MQSDRRVWRTLARGSVPRRRTSIAMATPSDMVRPVVRRTTEPAEAFRIAREDGIAMLVGCDCSTREAVALLPSRVFGSTLAAVQTPVHVGMNNTGFSGTRRLAHTETRGMHQDESSLLR